MIVRARQLGASPALIGAMFAFLGAGAIVGAAIAPWVQRRVPARVVVIGSLWLWAAGMAVLVLPPNALALGALAAVMWITGPPFNVVVSAYRYALVPDRLQARTQSAAAGRLGHDPARFARRRLPAADLRNDRLLPRPRRGLARCGCGCDRDPGCTERTPGRGAAC
jgi:hypothetical protein